MSEAAPSPAPPQIASDVHAKPVPPVEGLAPGTVADWLAWGERELAAHSDSARADAELLLAALIGAARSTLALRHEDAIEAATVLRYAGWIERRRLGEPVAYLIGLQGFWTIDLVVDTAVLIPRADTETLVEWALALAREALKTGPLALADLGTGSGAIALALADELRGQAVAITATDASEAALAVAEENARRLGLIERVEFRSGDWFTALPAQQRYGLIVSNPPYIADGDAHLDALRYEPRCALTAGHDGLADIRRIIADARTHLLPGGWLLLEHGHDQGEAVRALFAAQGYAAIATRRDFGGNERVTGARWP